MWVCGHRVTRSITFVAPIIHKPEVKPETGERGGRKEEIVTDAYL